MKTITRYYNYDGKVLHEITREGVEYFAYNYKNTISDDTLFVYIDRKQVLNVYFKSNNKLFMTCEVVVNE